LGPLDELIIDGCSLRIYLAPFFDFPWFHCKGQLFEFPLVKELTVSHPLSDLDEAACMDAIVKLAKAQHARGMAFERVTIHALPTATAERFGTMGWCGKLLSGVV